MGPVRGPVKVVGEMRRGTLRAAIFLHGYQSPGEPSLAELESAARHAGTQVAILAPVAPSGPDRVDPFNLHGMPSWFRYSSDLTTSVPQRPDDPHGPDVQEMIWGADGLLAMVEMLVGEHSAQSVAIIGESQGGVMAAFLAMAWARAHPDAPLGGIGLVRTAPHPWTWRDLSPVGPGEPWPTGEGSLPPRLASTFAVVLGQDDPVFRPYASLYALGPLLETNPAAPPSVTGAASDVEGNVRIRVLPGVDHVHDTELVFTTLFAELAR